ncbi:carbohydrate-binding module family 13 protein [Agrocybe pediades]|nr:carbohydrate-binding module family 13 protein [Agrocybe pediades]
MALNIASGNRYIIVNTKSQTVMDLSGSDGVSVIGFPKHGQANQQWELVFAETGWHIKSVSSGKYLQVAGGHQGGSRIVATNVPFIWYIWADNAEVTSARISVPGCSCDIDLSEGGSVAPCTPVQLWDRTEGARNQVWRFEKG